MSQTVTSDGDEDTPWEVLAEQRDLFEKLADDDSQPLSELSQDIIDELDRRGINVSR